MLDAGAPINMLTPTLLITVIIALTSCLIICFEHQQIEVDNQNWEV